MKCAQCGAELLLADAPAGHCPACLLRLAISGEAASGGANPRGRDGAQPLQGIASRFFADYELVEEIARGGMGIVYRARQLSLNREVALKMILDGPLASRGFIERFHVEAEAAAKLSHPNIVPIYEIGEHQGRHFFSMKLLEGGNLGERMIDFALPARPPGRSGGGLGEQRTFAHQRRNTIARLVVTLARALQHAHERGILHRDLKPTNILLDAEGQPYITDFGLAKLVEDDSQLTQTGALLGTPAYMAPEQASGDAAQLTTAADIYSLGAVLYHLLAGRPPFQAASAVETLRQVVGNDPVPPDRLNGLVDRDLTTICLKCLNKDPAARYTSARALAEDLQRWQNGETIVAVPATRMDYVLRWCRRNPAWASLAGIVFVLLIAVTIISTTAAFRIERARQAAIAAEKKATEQLRESFLAQARAQRWSGQAGRRFESLRALTNAAAIRTSIDLRNEAIACLALTDIHPLPGAPQATNAAARFRIDWRANRYTQAEPDGSISLHRLDNRAELLRLPSQGSPVNFVLHFSPNGRWLGAAYQDGAVRIFNLERRDVALRFEDADFTFSPDSTRAAFIIKNSQVVLAKLDGTGTQSLFTSSTPIYAPRWSPDGKVIACLSTNGVYLLDAGSGNCTGHFSLPGRPFDLAWHPNGIRLAACDDRLIHVWNSRSGVELGSLAGHLGTVTSLSFSPDGALLASCGWDGFLRLWDLSSGKEIISTPAGPEGIDFSPDGQRLAVYAYNATRVGFFEVATNQVCADLTSHILAPGAESGNALLFGREDWLATSAGSALVIWQPKSGQALDHILNLPPKALQLLPPGQGLFGCAPEGLFRLGIEQTNGAFRARRPEPFHVAIPDKLKSQCPPGLLEKSDHSPEYCGVSSDGRVGAVVFEDHCYIFDLLAGTLQAITGPQAWMKYVAASPDGRWIATGGWHYPNVKIWDAATGREEKVLPTEISPNVAFSPDGRWLVTGTGGEYRFWHTGDWSPAHRIGRPGADDLPGPMAFSRDGKVLALAHTRGTVHLVAPESGELLAQIEPVPENELTGLALNADASELALTRVAAPLEIWHLQRIREQLAAMGLDW